MKKLRIGFIGSGGMADAHLSGLSNAEKFPDVQIAAFCDVVPERAQAQCDKYSHHNPKAYSSPQEMLADAGLDACFILLPPFAHGDAERACLEYNVPFLVEKPLGKDLELLREIRDEVRRRNLLTAAGYMNRYQPGVQRAKEVLSHDEPILAYGGWLGGPPLQSDDYLSRNLIGQWWSIKEKSGGQLIEQVTHTVDLISYFLGDAEEVFAYGTTAFNKKLPNLTPGYSIEDASIVNVKFKSGALANIMSSCSTPVGGGILLNILGAKTGVHFTGWGHGAKVMFKDTEDNMHEEAVQSASEIFPLEDRAFLDAVATGDRSKILCDYEAGFKTAQITLLADAAMQTGRPQQVTD